MTPFVGELVGTLILVTLGNGVVANVILPETKGHAGGWIAITAGWGFAVFTAVLCVSEVSGAHLNPAVTLGLALAGKFAWAEVGSYVAAQMLGGFCGACLVYACYHSHYQRCGDPDTIRATFCTGPAIRSLPHNFLCEAVATFVLVYAVLMAQPASFALPDATGVADPTTVEVGLGAVGAFPVGIVVFAIGLCLGGPSGYAINPARDLAPRVAHAVLPLQGKQGSDWTYAPVPILGPLAGAALAAALALLLGS